MFRKLAVTVTLLLGSAFAPSVSAAPITFAFGDDLLGKTTPLSMVGVENGNPSALVATITSSPAPNAFSVGPPPIPEPSNMLSTSFASSSLRIAFNLPISNFRTVFFTGTFGSPASGVPLTFTALSGATEVARVTVDPGPPFGAPVSEALGQIGGASFDTVLIGAAMPNGSTPGFGILAFTVERAQSAQPVPEPASLALLGAGLLGLATMYGRRATTLPR